MTTIAAEAQTRDRSAMIKLTGSNKEKKEAVKMITSWK